MQEKKLMPPLWIAYPYMERYSIGWRMGSGEEYRYNIYDWFKTLSPSEQNEYMELFPEPKSWCGFWDEFLERDYDEFQIEKMHYIHNDFSTHFWQENGKPLYNIDWLRKRYKSGEKTEFVFFWGYRPSKNGITKSCFSQWWKSEFHEEHYKYCCMEQYMMSKKALLFDDKEVFEQIMVSDEPNKIKSLGRKIRNFDEKIWNDVKYSIVLNGNYLKFTQNRNLMNFLLSTGDKILVEASPTDRVWGIGMSENDERINNPYEWQGENLLGFALTEVREEIKSVYANEGLVDYSLVK